MVYILISFNGTSLTLSSIIYKLIFILNSLVI